MHKPKVSPATLSWSKPLSLTLKDFVHITQPKAFKNDGLNISRFSGFQPISFFFNLLFLIDYFGYLLKVHSTRKWIAIFERSRTFPVRINFGDTKLRVIYAKVTITSSFVNSCTKNKVGRCWPVNDGFTVCLFFCFVLFCFVLFCLLGKDRQLCSVELKQIMSRARQTNSAVPLNPLASQAIEKITNCHLFAVGQVCRKFYTTFLFTSAIDKKVSIWNRIKNGCLWGTQNCLFYTEGKLYGVL